MFFLVNHTGVAQAAQKFLHRRTPNFLGLLGDVLLFHRSHGKLCPEKLQLLKQMWSHRSRTGKGSGIERSRYPIGKESAAYHLQSHDEA